MKKHRLSFLLFLLQVVALTAFAQSSAPSAVHPPVGTTSGGGNGQISLKLVNKHINYKGSPAEYRDPYIQSPKSANIHPDGTKYYVNSLEGCATVVYDMKTHQRLKVINYRFEVVYVK